MACARDNRTESVKKANSLLFPCFHRREMFGIKILIQGTYTLLRFLFKLFEDRITQRGVGYPDPVSGINDRYLRKRKMKRPPSLKNDPLRKVLLNGQNKLGGE